jgi:nitrite reductase (NADH) large subunit
MAHIVIIGNSVAGHSAAVNIRARDEHAALTLVSAEPYSFYDRRRLCDFLRGTIKEQDLFPCAGDFYARQNIVSRTGVTVAAVNPLKRTLAFKDAKGSMSYDILVVATGMRHAACTFPGAKKPGVVTLYSLDDVKKFMARLVTEPVCILGWNKGAVAMAGAIAERYGVDVKLLAPSGADAAALPAHVEIVCEPVVEIIGEGCVQAIKLSNGKIIAVGTVVNMVEEPSLDFLRTTLVRVSGKGIEVDGQLRTSVERVFACGTVACTPDGPRAKTWNECAEEGCYLADSISKEMERACRISS